MVITSIANFGTERPPGIIRSGAACCLCAHAAPPAAPRFVRILKIETLAAMKRAACQESARGEARINLKRHP
jgi:hypothetical protein